MLWVFIAAAVIGAVGGIVFTATVHAAPTTRRAAAFVAAAFTIASVAVFLHEWHIAARLDASVGFVDRLHIFLGADRLGSALNDAGLLCSFFAIKRARASLVVGNAMLTVMWVSLFMGL